jgi:glutamine---fructose-6-phosphate transaminase (isomerizing)
VGAASTMRVEALAVAEVAATALTRQQERIEDVAARLRAARPRGFVTIARGTSDHAAEYAIRLVGRKLGLIGASLPPSLVTLAAAPLDFREQVVLAISQSGQSPDVVEALAAARAVGALTVALVNAPTSPLADAAELVLAIDAGPERAVAATKSYVLSLLQIARLVAAWAGDGALRDAVLGLPSPLAQAVAVDWTAAVPAFVEAPSAFVVGRGLAYATAREAALKLKEVAGLHAEALSAAEIMHGPKALL